MPIRCEQIKLAMDRSRAQNIIFMIRVDGFRYYASSAMREHCVFPPRFFFEDPRDCVACQRNINQRLVRIALRPSKERDKWIQNQMERLPLPQYVTDDRQLSCEKCRTLHIRHQCFVPPLDVFPLKTSGKFICQHAVVCVMHRQRKSIAGTHSFWWTAHQCRHKERIRQWISRWLLPLFGVRLVPVWWIAFSSHCLNSWI